MSGHLDLLALLREYPHASVTYWGPPEVEQADTMVRCWRSVRFLADGRELWGRIYSTGRLVNVVEVTE
jgi:hypothetical protein